MIGHSWVGRYRESFIGSDGQEQRIRRAVVLGSKKELPTKRLAERHLELQLARVNALSYRPGRVATLEEFVERWKLEVLSKRKASTQHAAESHVRNQIVPLLGKLPLHEIGAENQQRFVTQLSGTVSRKMLLNVLGTLSSILATAQNWGYVSEGLNFRKLALPEGSIKEARPHFDASTVAKIINMATGQYRVMFAIAAMTGLRVGEILALQAGDFDLERKLLTVRRSVWRGAVSTPKTQTSQAVMPVPDALVKTVQQYLGTCKKLPGDWLFLNTRGHLFIAENVVRQALTPILDRLNLPRCGFHAFRHTYSTMLLDVANPKEHQEQMRHADPRVTIGVYSHVNAQSRRVVAEKVASILDSNGLESKPITQVIQ